MEPEWTLSVPDAPLTSVSSGPALRGGSSVSGRVLETKGVGVGRVVGPADI